MLSFESVYYHYRKWCVSGVWKTCWIGMLDRHKSELDLSSVGLDGSHTTAIRGGEEVEYQGRKKRKTINALYLSDRQGLPIAMSEPLAGKHNDLYNIEVQFEVVTATLEQANINLEDLFLNADAGFDSKDFRNSCEKKGSIPMCVSTNAMSIPTGTNILTKNYITKDMQLNGQTPGWTVIANY